MSKNLTEQEVLRKLKIDDFSQMTVKQFFELTSMKNVDPEIIKKAIEQIPEFAELIREMINHQKETVEKAMKSNDESMKNCFDAWNRSINILEKELENENLSFDERMEIIECVSLTTGICVIEIRFPQNRKEKFLIIRSRADCLQHPQNDWAGFI